MTTEGLWSRLCIENIHSKTVIFNRVTFVDGIGNSSSIFALE